MTELFIGERLKVKGKDTLIPLLLRRITRQLSQFNLLLIFYESYSEVLEPKPVPKNK